MSRASGIVNAASPINWADPLNNGLIGEWAVIPNTGWSGGLTLRDLMRGGRNTHDGIFDPGLYPAGWKGPAAPGSYGRVQFNGTDKVFLPAGIWPAGDFTVVLDFMVTSTSAYQAILSSYTADANSFEIFIDNTTRVMFGCYSVSAVTAVGSIAINTPYNLAVPVASNALNKAYINGVNKAASTGTLAFSTRSLFTNLGRRTNGNFQLANGGWVSRFSLYNYALPVDKIQALYAESKAGNPNRWNWLDEDDEFWAVSAATTLIQPYEVIQSIPLDTIVRYPY